MLDFQPIHIPLAQGLDTKAHEFALDLPKLAVCTNAEFSQPGSVGKREGTITLGNAIDGGGTLSDIKGLAVRDDELVCFAKHRVYSWTDQTSEWVERSAYLGCEVTSKTVCSKPTTQRRGDRASYAASAHEVVVYAWLESSVGFATTVHVQAFDGITGAALTADTDLGANSIRPRCLTVGTKIHVYYHDTGAAEIKVKVIDPTNVSGTIGNAALTVSGVADVHATATYDVVVRGTSSQAILAYRDIAGNYFIGLISSAGAVGTNTTKGVTVGVPLAVAYESNLDRIAVFYDSGANLVGDILNGTTLADVSVGTVISAAASITDMTAAFRNVSGDGGTSYRAVVFWTEQYTIGNLLRAVKAKYLGTDAATGAVAGPSGSTYWAIHADIAARAFAYGTGATTDPAVNVVLRVFPSTTLGLPSPLQSTLVVYREDGLMLARLDPWLTDIVSVSGLPLPQVEQISTHVFSFVGCYRVRVGIRGTNLFADPNLRDHKLDFSSAKPYRGVQLGKALYMPGGLGVMYDGVGVVESGFALNPGEVTVASSNGTGTIVKSDGSAVAAGDTVTYRIYWEWQNIFGEVERSSFSEVFTVTFAANDDTVTVTVPTFPHTLKRSPRSAVVLAVYRSEINPGQGAPFYRVSSLDPTATGNNGYVVNDPTTGVLTFVDGMADGTLTSQQPDYQNSGELDNLAPEPCGLLVQGQGRLFAAGLNDPNLIRYSKRWEQDKAVAWNDALDIIVPQDGGPVTALHATDTALVIFKEHRIYLCTGIGMDNLGQGGFSEPQLLPCDTGCSDARSVVATPGGIMFQSPKGIYILTPALTLEYIGAPVEDHTTSQTMVGAFMLEGKNTVLFVGPTTSLAYDYLVGQWSAWTNPIGSAAVPWQGLVVYAPSSSTVFKTTSTKTDNGTAYSLILETPWIKFAGYNGFKRVRRFALLGKYMGAHSLRVRVAYNYVLTYVDDITWTVDSSRYEVRQTPSRQKITSLRVRIEDTGSSGDAYAAAGLSFDVGIKKGLARLPSASSQ